MRQAQAYRYRICGFVVSSDVDIPGLHADDGEGAADIAIRQGEVAESLPGAIATGPTFSMTASQLLLRVPGLVDFQLSEGREIVYQPGPAAAPGDVAAFIIGTAFGILLQQRGEVTLQASAVRVRDHAVLFLGSSGDGKSTLAAALAQRGYPMVADDICVLRLGADGAPLVWPDARQARLWTASIQALELGASQGSPVRGALAKFHVSPALVAPLEALPVGPLYGLHDTLGAGKPGIVRWNIVDAALALRSHAYRPRLVPLLGQAGRYLDHAAAVASRGGVFRLTCDMRFASLPGVLDDLERSWGGDSNGARAA